MHAMQNAPRAHTGLQFACMHIGCRSSDPAHPSLARRFSDTARAPMMIDPCVHACNATPPMTTTTRASSSSVVRRQVRRSAQVGLRLPTSSSSPLASRQAHRSSCRQHGRIHAQSVTSGHLDALLFGRVGCCCCSVATPVRVHALPSGRVSSAPLARSLAALVHWMCGGCSQSASSAFNL